MDNYRDTVLAQYANSPAIGALIDNLDGCIRPDVDIDAVYEFIWNVQTAQGFGLDILGRIVNISRNVSIPGENINFGFKEALPTSHGFGQEPFYSGQNATAVFELSDAAYRTLILAKAMINISSATAKSVNAMLQTMFAGRGVCYVVDKGGMQIQYIFKFPLKQWEQAVMNSSFLQHPAGVQSSIQVSFVDFPYFYGNFYYNY